MSARTAVKGTASEAAVTLHSEAVKAVKSFAMARRAAVKAVAAAFKGGAAGKDETLAQYVDRVAGDAGIAARDRALIGIFVMGNEGTYTQRQIADALGVSAATVNRAFKSLEGEDDAPKPRKARGKSGGRKGNGKGKGKGTSLSDRTPDELHDAVETIIMELHERSDAATLQAIADSAMRAIDAIEVGK